MRTRHKPGPERANFFRLTRPALYGLEEISVAGSGARFVTSLLNFEKKGTYNLILHAFSNDKLHRIEQVRGLELD